MALVHIATMTTVVSVVLPAFNRLKYLRSAVASVFAQTVPDWELLVADDGSDTETRAYLRSLEGASQVRILWLSHCGIPAAVRNAALAEARGEYVAFLDSDDEWMPHKLERQLAALRARPERRWSYTGYILIDAEGKPLPSGYLQRTLHHGAILGPLLANDVDIWTPAVVAERRLLVQLGGFNPRLTLFEDYDLWLRLATQSEIELVDEPLVAVRRHDEHTDPPGVSWAACRNQSLRTLEPLVHERHLRVLVGRAQASSALEVVCTQAELDPRAAARSILGGSSGAWRYWPWWAGLPRVLLKLLLPQALLNSYRRKRRQD